MFSISRIDSSLHSQHSNIGGSAGVGDVHVGSYDVDTKKDRVNIGSPLSSNSLQPAQRRRGGTEEAMIVFTLGIHLFFTTTIWK